MIKRLAGWKSFVTFLLVVLLSALSSAVADHYNEAPILAEMVAAGELPPVDERLPLVPFVREVVNEIGVYGGTLRKWDNDARGVVLHNLYYWNFNNDMGGYGFNNPLDLVQYIDDGLFFSGHAPLYAESFEYNDDFTEVTVRLREGVRWSDGSLFTADDIVWSWNNIATNDNVFAPPGHWAVVEGGAKIQAELIDEMTVKFISATPHPRMHTRVMIYDLIASRAFMEPVHPDFSDTTWEEFRDYRLLGNAGAGSVLHPEMPQLGPWMVVSTDPIEGGRSTRNPYYPVVDQEGNQLPYIDHLRIRIASPDAGILSTFQGQVDIQAEHYSDLANFQVLKENEERGDYQVLVWKSGGVQGYLLFNIDTKSDEQLAGLMRQADFRRAVSLAMNRQEVNDTLYFGLADVSGTVVSPESAFHDPAMDLYAEYAPERARSMLEALGLQDTNGDGILEYADGGNVTIIVNGGVNLAPHPEVDQMMVNYMREVGLDAIYDPVQSSVIFEGRAADTVQVYSNWGPSNEVILPWLFMGAYYDPDAYMGNGLDDPPEEFVRMWELEQATITSFTPEEFSANLKEFWIAFGDIGLQQIAITSTFPVPMIRHNRMGNVPDFLPKSRPYDATPDQFFIKYDYDLK